MKQRLWADLGWMGRQLQEMVAPQRCIHCLAEQSWHCADCQISFRPQALQCLVCRRSDPRGATCRSCREEMALDGLVTSGSYHSPRLRRGVGWLKFRGVQAIAPQLAWLVSGQVAHIAPLARLQQTGLLIPIPLHARRERQRGFNQSALLAQELSRLLSIPTCNALTRQRATAVQSQLPQAAREENMADAFVCSDSNMVAGKRFLLLVDDVVTSGSTLSAAARSLPRSKGAQIWGVAVARG